MRSCAICLMPFPINKFLTLLLAFSNIACGLALSRKRCFEGPEIRISSLNETRALRTAPAILHTR